MTGVAVFSAVVLAVAGPDLVTVAEALRPRGRHRRHVSRWWLVVAVAAPHAALVPAAMLLNRGGS